MARDNQEITARLLLTTVPVRLQLAHRRVCGLCPGRWARSLLSRQSGLRIVPLCASVAGRHLPKPSAISLALPSYLKRLRLGPSRWVVAVRGDVPAVCALSRASPMVWEVPDGAASGHGQRSPRWSGGAGSGVRGPGLPQRVRAEPAGSWAGGALLDPASGNPIPSPALMDQIGQRFRRAVDSYAEANRIPVVRFVKGQRKVDVMRPLMARAAATARSQVVAVGLAQEYAWVATAGTTHTESGYPHFTFGRAQRRVSCVYFYLWDADMGAAFIKVCAYLPYPMKIWVNGHEWAKRQATSAGIGFHRAGQRVRLLR